MIQVAQTVITRFTDDLDGSQASGSVAFGLDGRLEETSAGPVVAAKRR